MHQILQRLQTVSKMFYGKDFRCFSGCRQFPKCSMGEDFKYFRAHAAKCFLTVGLCWSICVLVWCMIGFSGSSPVLLAFATFLKLTPCIHTKLTPCIHTTLTPCIYTKLTPSIHTKLKTCIHTKLTLCIHTKITPCIHTKLTPSIHTKLTDFRC